MSRNNDSLPMLPPWLSESDVTQVGYEAPVENLPQDDEIDEAPKRRRFMGGRGDDAPRKDKGRRRRKDREAEEEAAAPRPGEAVDQRRPAEPTHQSGSGWSTPQQPADPLIPGPSHQQPRREEQPRPQPTYEQPTYEQPTHQTGRDASQYQQPHQQAAPAQPNAGWQAAPNPLIPPVGVPPSSADPAPRPDANGPSSIPGPSAADPAPWAGGQASTAAPWSASQPPADHAPTSTGTPPPLPPSPTSSHTHAGPATPAPTSEAADHAANALPTRTPAPPSTGFTPLGPNQQRPDLPPPPPLPDPPARPTQAPPRLTVPPQSTTAEPRPVTADHAVEQADHAPSPVTARDEVEQPATDAPSTPAPSEVEQSADVEPRPPSSFQEAEQATPPRRAAAEVPEPSTATTVAESAESPTTGARHSADERSVPDEDAVASRHGSPYSSGESVVPQRPPATEQRSPYASGEHVPPPAYPATQYNSVPGDPTPVVPTHAPDGRTEVFRSEDPRLQGSAPGEHGQASRQGGTNAAEQARAAHTGYRSGEFVQAADAASPYPRPDGTPAQHQQPDGLPTYGPDGVAQRPDGAPVQQYLPDSSPAPQFQQPNQGAQQQFPPNGPAPQYQPDGTHAQQYQPDSSPAPQFQQPNQGAQQQFPPNGPAPQYQPDGTHAQQYQQPNAPQQYQQPGNYQQGQQQPYGQPGWGAQPQGYQPSLDDVPVKRAKKAPGSGWRKAVHHVSGGAINPGMSAEELRLQELVARIRQPVRGDYRIAVLSLKGGVGKTTTTTGLGSIFASIRGDRVIAVDANPDFGTLSQRVAIQTRSTVRDLLLDPAIQRYSDVRRHTSQGSSRLEVLASERDPAASEAFNDEEYRAVARILQRFYNIILTDCGTGLMHSAMSGVLDLAHSLVLISSAAIDGARSAAATLDWLSLHGHDHLVRNAVVVINLPREGSPNVGVQQLREYFLSRCRAVHIIPFDEHLSEGAEIDLHRLHKTTKRAYVELAATVADEFSVHHHRLG
ncbi:AAA family ATPase [Nocardia sp. NPDC127606]|uniref:nucleotide-binding protein n=1 Tax=Nocardia sp. NPDC127606 TaxID=3345406 RepID=UPI0036423AF0